VLSELCRTGYPNNPSPIYSTINLIAHNYYCVAYWFMFYFIDIKAMKKAYQPMAFHRKSVMKRGLGIHSWLEVTVIQWLDVE